MASNTVIDLSHYNSGTLQFGNAKADGIIGVIQKATQGTDYVDATLQKNRTAILAAGLLFGAYHFGTGTDGVAQAEHFLNTVQPDGNTLVALDFEDNPTGPSMTIEEAQAFVTHINAELGRWPVFYSGHTIKRVLGSAVDPVLKNCPFWLAQFGPTPVVPACWSTWTLWQYTDGGNGPDPHSVNGIGTCDREQFNGSDAQLQSWWAK
jgi:lysozyme